MGSPKISIVKTQTMENKSFKPFSFLKSLFQDKKKEKDRERRQIDKNEPRETKADLKKTETPVARIIEQFNELNIDTSKKVIEEDAANTKTIKTIDKDEEDELDNFTFQLIEDDRRSNRMNSQSSEDSGFADNDVVETLQNLTLNDKEEKKTEDRKETETKDKKTKQVLVKRSPIRSKVSDHSVHPYTKSADSACIPINQVNQQTLTGGHVIVNPTAENCSELDEILGLESVSNIYNSNPVFWEHLLDAVSIDANNLSKLPQITEEQTHFNVIPERVQISNPIEEFPSINNLLSYENDLELTSSILNLGNIQFPNNLSQNDSLAALQFVQNIPQNDGPTFFPTPPRSENVPSPLSESQAFYPSNSEYTLSPERSSPIHNSDFERYQEITPLSSVESFEENKGRDLSSQTSRPSMTMKNFKDLQKEIAHGLSKKECCDINRKPTKEIFEEHMQKLKLEERKNLCYKVSNLDLKTAYGVLHNILLTLSKVREEEDLQYALFALVCQRVLAQKPALFTGDFGLSILMAAALRCPHHPLLTRHTVQCVYMALRSEPKLCTNDCVFHEVDAQGDNLVIACVRGGDAYALVLAEITRSDTRGELPPLFRLHHANSDGYTALHVACREHSTSSARLHIVHVLLEHAKADLWKGDIKGGDTAAHLAVNSATCCLNLVLLLFKYEDRKLWKKLAHAKNMSSVTPLEYARSADRSTTRQNYPQEVLNFLHKCR